MCVCVEGIGLDTQEEKEEEEEDEGETRWAGADLLEKFPLHGKPAAQALL